MYQPQHTTQINQNVTHAFQEQQYQTQQNAMNTYQSIPPIEPIVAPVPIPVADIPPAVPSVATISTGIEIAPLTTIQPPDIICSLVAETNPLAETTLIDQPACSVSDAIEAGVLPKLTGSFNRAARMMWRTKIGGLGLAMVVEAV